MPKYQQRLALLTLSLCLAEPAAGVTYDTRVYEGVSFPDAGPDAVFADRFLTPTINGLGQVAFAGGLVNASDGRGLGGIFSEAGGSLSAVVRVFDKVPSVDGTVTLNTLFFQGGSPLPHPTVHLNDAGQTAFISAIYGGFSVLSEGQGTLRVTAKQDDPVPGLDDRDIAYTDIPAFNDAGESVFFVQTNHGGPAVLSERGGTLNVVAASGEPAPWGTMSATFFQFDYLNSAIVNNNGYTAFRAQVLVDIEPRPVSEAGLFSDRSGTLTALYRQGEQVPGLEAGVMFKSFGYPTINDADQIAFVAGLADEETDLPIGGALLLDTAGGLTVIARTGDAVPGMDAGVTFMSVGDAVINASGHAAFRATYGDTGAGTSAHGLFIDTGSGPELAVRLGDQVPGAEPGVVLDTFTFTEYAPLVDGFTLLSLNDLGQAVFAARLAGPGVTTDNQLAVFATDPSGQLEMIAREGSVYDVNDDPLIEDLRTIKTITLALGSGGGDGRHRSLNNNGQVAYLLEFTDLTNAIVVADTSPTVAGDTDNDNDVDNTDLQRAIAHFTGPTGTGQNSSTGDTDLDNDVDNSDLQAAIAGFTGPANNPPVPEPGALALMGLGGVVLGRRRCRPVTR